MGLEERGTPMLDARTARILARENEEDIEARRRREMVERITRTWDGDALGRIYGLAHATYHDRIAETFASSDDLDEPWGDWTCPCRE